MEKTLPKNDYPALLSAKGILQALIATYKKLNFYSSTHPVYREALVAFKKTLDDHIEQFDAICITVERDRYLFEDSILQEGKPEPTDLLYILHRDGIAWLEFRAGIELWEIELLLKTINDHSRLDEDAEDDIATVLWELGLPSIAYEAVDIDLGLVDDIDFDELRLSHSATQEPEDVAIDNPIDTTISAPMATPLPELTEMDGQDELFHLQPSERKQLQDMIAAEEKLDGSDYAVDVLLYVFGHHPLVEDVDGLIDDMTHAMKDTLVNQRFSYLFESLGKIKKQIEIFKSESHWSVPHLEKFVSSLAAEPFLSNLKSIMAAIDSSSPENLQDLKGFLSGLDAIAIYYLSNLMMQSRSDKFQRLLMEAITNLAKKDFRPLEKLIFDSNKVLAGNLVYILRFFSDEHSLQILFKLLDDPSEMIRKQAVKALVARDVQAAEKLFRLIDDPDKMIRALVLDHLGRGKNGKAEQLLLAYLKSDSIQTKDPDHYREVFRTLGKCASDKSLPLLKKCLFKWPRIGILRYSRSLQREGALIALNELNTPEAAILISRSRLGFFKNFLRSA